MDYLKLHAEDFVGKTFEYFFFSAQATQSLLQPHFVPSKDSSLDEKLLFILHEICQELDAKVSNKFQVSLKYINFFPSNYKKNMINCCLN